MKFPFALVTLLALSSPVLAAETSVVLVTDMPLLSRFTVELRKSVGRWTNLVESGPTSIALKAVGHKTAPGEFLNVGPVAQEQQALGCKLAGRLLADFTVAVHHRPKGKLHVVVLRPSPDCELLLEEEVTLNGNDTQKAQFLAKRLEQQVKSVPPAKPASKVRDIPKDDLEPSNDVVTEKKPDPVAAASEPAPSDPQDKSSELPKVSGLPPFVEVEAGAGVVSRRFDWRNNGAPGTLLRYDLLGNFALRARVDVFPFAAMPNALKSFGIGGEIVQSLGLRSVEANPTKDSPSAYDSTFRDWRIYLKLRAPVKKAGFLGVRLGYGTHAFSYSNSPNNAVVPAVRYGHLFVGPYAHLRWKSLVVRGELHGFYSLSQGDVIEQFGEPSAWGLDVRGGAGVAFSERAHLLLSATYERVFISFAPTRLLPSDGGTEQRAHIDLTMNFGF
ncbi:MAG: hypothetical protein KBF88_15530 [Polyangiaceae bacterium]|nr:hypothetical protein [Polyangiaceae bacterium]